MSSEQYQTYDAIGEDGPTRIATYVLPKVLHSEYQSSALLLRVNIVTRVFPHKITIKVAGVFPEGVVANGYFYN